MEALNKIHCGSIDALTWALLKNIAINMPMKANSVRISANDIILINLIFFPIADTRVNYK